MSTFRPWSWTTKTLLHEVPLAPAEIPYCCADLGSERFLLFLGLGFGGRGFPLVFGRVASFVGRVTQAMFHPDIARLQTYVDDPILSVSGTPTQAQPIFDITILLWLLMGASLSWEKGVLSSNSHTWIGIEYSLERGFSGYADHTPFGGRPGLQPHPTTRGHRPRAA